MKRNEGDKPPLYFDNHAQDSRVIFHERIGCCVSEKYGTGGGTRQLSYRESSYGMMAEDAKAGPLRSSGGTSGGGGENLIVQRLNV